MTDKGTVIQQVHIQRHPPGALGWILRFLTSLPPRAVPFFGGTSLSFFPFLLSEGLSFRSLYLISLLPRVVLLRSLAGKVACSIILIAYYRDIIKGLSIVTTLLFRLPFSR